MATLRMVRPWRDPRTGRFYLKRRIPARFAPVAGHKGDQIKISLHTSDPAEAARRWAGALAEWDGLVAEWERLLAMEAVTQERAKEIAAGWVASLQAGAPLDMGGEDDEVFAPWVEGSLRTPERLARMNARIDFHTDEALRLAKVAVTPETLPILRKEVAIAAMHAYIQGPSSGLRIVNPKRPYRSNFDAYLTTMPPVAVVPALPMAGPPVLSFAALMDSWALVAGVNARTKQDARYAMDAFKRFLGHDDAAKVTKDDMLRWREAQKAEGKSNTTWNNRLSLVHQPFAQAVKDGRLEVNPADNSLRLDRDKVSHRLPYSDDDAKRILLAARKETKATLRWAHWVMAFSGMRVGEVLQLLGRNIRQDGRSGVWFMEVTPEDEGSSVKNGQKRHVPMHPALIAEGFLAYAQGIAPDAPLFPDKAADKFGQRGGRGWNAVGKWVRETVGIKDKAKAPNHSWRHRVEDELRGVEVPEDARDAIVGHARRTTGRLYGVRGEELSRLHRELSKLPNPLTQEGAAEAA